MMSFFRRLWVSFRPHCGSLLLGVVAWIFGARSLAFAADKPSATPDKAAVLRKFREEFVRLTPGTGAFPRTLRMGGAAEGSALELPAHDVVFDEPFAIARYEVTQELWEVVLADKPSRWPGPRNAVERISFADAQKFCQKVTEDLRSAGLIEKHQTVGLPSEAQWEYAARAGTKTVYSFGDAPDKLGDYAWFTGNAAGNDPPVGAKKPNPWGLYDMHGYVSEWCSDVWHESYADAPRDGRPWTTGGDAARRVIRGGSWKDKADRCTSSSRAGLPAEARDDSVGLRCILADEKR